MTHYLTVGTSVGKLITIDAITKVIIASSNVITTTTDNSSFIPSSSCRVSSLAYNDYTITCGTQYGTVIQFDLRISAKRPTLRYIHDSNEICHLKWDMKHNTNTLASSSSDTICIWDNKMLKQQQGSITKQYYNNERDWNSSHVNRTPFLILKDRHATTSSVNAFNWCPYRRGILASGGGNGTVGTLSDGGGTIKIWDTTISSSDYNNHNYNIISSVNTDNPVSSIHWNPNHHNELITSHRRYTYNDININSTLMLWKTTSSSSSHPRTTLTKIKKSYQFHNNDNYEGNNNHNVIGTAINPNRTTIVSAGTDECLCFWDLNDNKNNNNTIQYNRIITIILLLLITMVTE